MTDTLELHGQGLLAGDYAHGKMFTTRDGHEARECAVMDRRSAFWEGWDKFVIRGYVQQGDKWSVHQWTAQGRWSTRAEHPLDLLK